MRTLIFGLLLAAALTGCASTEAKRHLGKSLTDLALDKGGPVNIINLPNGRRAYQYYWGGTTTSKGCLLTYIASKQGQRWIIKEVRWPQRLVC